jgi:Ca2+:H+ antiporter
MVFRWLLLFIPITAVLAYGVHAPPMATFGCSLIALVPLAEYVRRATDQLARRAGPAMGGLLNVSFGNVPELVLGLFLLHAGQAEVVKAQITGAIIGNSLLGLGLAIVIGGFGRDKQTFRKDRAGLAGSLLVLVVIALLLPALFRISQRGVLGPAPTADMDQRLSVGVAIVLILVYIANLVYTFVTHRDVFASSTTPEPAHWGTNKSIAVLLGATIGTAFEAELISGSLGDTAAKLGFSPVFIGIVLIAVVGNVAEYFSAIYFARANKMGIALSITVGSTIQIALLVAPLLVLLSSLTGHPLNLVFGDPLEMMAIGGSAFAVNAIAQDGETTWFEGALLLAVYVLFAMGFYYSSR